jgi:hypothetical protein
MLLLVKGMMVAKDSHPIIQAQPIDMLLVVVVVVQEL